MPFIFIKNLVSALLLLFVLLQPSAASAQQAPAIKTSYLIDKKGDFLVEMVEKMPFTPVQLPFSRGYTPTVTWLKVEVAESDIPHLVLSIQPTFLDNVRLYRHTSENGWQPEQMGDHFPFSQRIRKERVFSFNIEPHKNHPSIFLVRIQSTSVSLIDIQVKTEDETIKSEMIAYGLIGIYTGLIAILVFISIWNFLNTKNKAWIINSLYQTTTLCVATGNTGFITKYVFPDMPNIADGWVSTTIILQSCFISLFFYHIIKKYNPYRWVLLISFLTTYIIPAISLIKIIEGQVQEAMQLTISINLITPGLITIGVFLLKIDDSIAKNILRGSCLILSSYILYFLIGFLGIGSTNVLNIYPPLLLNLLLALLNTLLLVRNDHLKKQEIYRELDKAKEIKNEFIKEKSMRMAESSLLSMLIHEIKNPMTTIRLAAMNLTSGRIENPALKQDKILHIEKATHEIDSILERTISIDELDNKRILIKNDPCDISFIIYEIVQECSAPDRIITNMSPDINGEIDGKLFNMITKNLINNAIKYSKENSNISINVIKEGNSITLTISNIVNNGCLPNPNLIFTKYYRSDHAQKFSGTGLGLYWVNGIVKMMGGRISYHSHENNVIFELIIPC